MDCEKARDRFSSLWEKELTPFEEKVVKEHLSSCPECQREFEQFEKTMRWLHSVGEVEVPDEFLPELYKKMEKRERITSAEKSRGGWFNFPLPFKLPVQAAAMVAVVFLVLYLTKMMPMGGYHPKETGQPSSPLSVGKKSEEVLARSAAQSPTSEDGVEKRRSGSTLSLRPELRPKGKIWPSDRGVEGLAQKEMEREPRALETTPRAPRTKNVEQAEAPVPGEEKLKGAYSPQMEAEAKKAEIPSSKTTVMGYRRVDSKEAAGARTSSREPEEIGKGLTSKEEPAVAPKPPQEIVLKISDRDKAISQLRELVKQFKGEIVTTEGNSFLASLPASSFSEFEKELVGVSSTGQTDKGMTRKHATGSLRALQEVKKEAIEGKSRETAKLATDEESRIVVRILLVQE